MRACAPRTRALDRASRCLSWRSKFLKLLHRSALAILLFTVPAVAQKPSAAEQFFFDSANRERVAEGLQPLKWDNALALAARRHAALMARETELSHRLPGELALDERAAQAGARFSKVGENIATGDEGQPIHTGWMHSPGHRANILDKHFTALGVGVIQEKGELYAVEDFSVWVENLGLEAQEEKVSALLTTRGLQVTNERSEARRFCDHEAVHTVHSKMAILRYEAPDIAKLPEQMERMIGEGKYQKAAVGACKPKTPDNSIPRFRITVLLF